MSFTLFNSFPPEIHSMILNQCPPNDLTCLRLTCKYLYNFFPEKLQHRIDLESEDTGPLCCEEVGKDWSAQYRHKRQCHALSYEKARARNEANHRSTPTIKRCRTVRYGGSPHCICFTRRNRLHYRLNSWIGDGLKYCGTCGRFTRRKKQHKGRCYHGQPKTRVCKGNFWTHRSRQGAFGAKLRKKWFNNAAMNKLEKRLNLAVRERNGSTRYDLRGLAPTGANTRVDRDSWW